MAGSTGRSLKVAICGGGVAGQALALWLSRRYPLHEDASLPASLRERTVQG
jgi:2-polyprenyl-6-methoxyphenol hydroxylase-like FAD-dependent oxidoreductase